MQFIVNEISMNAELRFSDQSDWSTLDPEYLERVGALEGGKLKSKP